MVFPATPAVVTLRAAFGADVNADPTTWTWTDITGYWEVSQPVTVSDGRSEGATQAEASEAVLTVDATDGALMPEDPRSPWWPHVDVGTPVWMVVNTGGSDHDLIRGFVSGLVPSWPGRSRHLCWVTLTVRGVLDRLGRGKSPLRTPIERAILADAPAAYWRLDDGQAATHAASAVDRMPPMGVTGAPRWADVDGPRGASGRYVTLREDNELIGSLSAQLPTASTDHWEVECWINVTVDPVGSLAVTDILSWTTTGTITDWRVEVSDAPMFGGPAGFVRVVGWYRYSPTQWSGYDFYITPGAWHHIRLTARQLGTGYMEFSCYVDDESVVDDTARLTTSVGCVRSIDAGTALHQTWPSSDGVVQVSMAHLAVYAAAAADHTPAGTGYAGEPASDRLARLCAEEGVPVTITPGVAEPMGPQPAATFLDLLRECEAADGGRLGEAGWGLAYRPRTSLYNQGPALTLTGTNGEIADPFNPVRDLQRRRNEWKISRPGGSSAVYADQADQTTAGRLDDSATLNLASDDVLVQHAAWRVALGTVRGLRYPSLSTDLGRHTGLIPAWQALHLGDRIQAVNPVRQHPPGTVDQLIEGRRQTLTGRTGWTVTLVTSPAAPYTVFVVADPARGRLDADAQGLDQAVDATTTTLRVATATGPLLATTAAYPGDFPFSADLGGEQVTVTAITGTTSPQTVTVTRAVNGIRKPHPAGTTLRLWQTARIAL